MQTLRKILCVAATLFIGCNLIPGSILAKTVFDDVPTNYVPIVITRSNNNENHLMRSLQTESIEAYYLNGYVYLTFQKSIGLFYVQITNTSTGEMVCETADSSDLQIAVNISVILSSGNYIIYIVPINSSSVSYEGSFQL